MVGQVRNAIIARCAKAYGPLPRQYSVDGVWIGYSAEEKARIDAEMEDGRKAREAEEAAAKQLVAEGRLYPGRARMSASGSSNWRETVPRRRRSDTGEAAEVPAQAWRRHAATRRTEAVSGGAPMNAAPHPERAELLHQFAAWPETQRLRFLVHAVTVHASRGDTDTIYWAVVSPLPRRNRRPAHRKRKGADAPRSA